MTSTRLETPDLNQAAFLMARGHGLLRLNGPPGGRRVFVFDLEARDDAEAFYRGAAVAARAYAHALADLKALLRQS